VAYIFYLKSPQTPHRLVSSFPQVYKLLYNKYYVDELYNAAFVRPAVKGSEAVYDNFDLGVIDGSINGTAKVTGLVGKLLSFFQSGLVKDYALVLLLGIIIFLGYLLL
jgi:NADH-quinone oxidoreductase subunit L